MNWTAWDELGRRNWNWSAGFEKLENCARNWSFAENWDRGELGQVFTPEENGGERGQVFTLAENGRRRTGTGLQKAAENGDRSSVRRSQNWGQVFTTGVRELGTGELGTGLQARRTGVENWGLQSSDSEINPAVHRQ